jgi:hypothetical protein
MNPQWIGCSPHNFQRGRHVGYSPEIIVIHVIVGSLLSADRWFNNPAASVSAHYGVGRDGSVHQYVAETDTAFHAGIVVNPTCELVIHRPNVNPNYYAIGIEHEGQPEDQWTDQQQNASAALIAEIAQRWNIPIDDQHVIQHHEIRASKTCPGGQGKVDELIALAHGVPAQPGPIIVGPAPTPPVPPVPENPAPVQPTPVPLAPVQFAPAQPSPVQHAEVRTVASVRVRRGAPSATAPVIEVLPAHTVIKPTGAVLGESIQGNQAWYSDANGNFIWAGGTDAPHPEI